MKVLIVDDEPLARFRLSSLIGELTDYQVAGEAKHGEEALLLASKLEPEIVLLDIEMPGIDGLETAAKLQQQTQPPAIIFTTAYDQHALEAFQKGGQAYLLKPINRQELLETLNRVQKTTRAQTLHLETSQNPQIRDHLSVIFRGDLRRIPVAEITYFKAEQKYVVIRHHETELLTEESLKSLEKEFHQHFIRVHRNALVAKTAITELRRDRNGHYSVFLGGMDLELEVSRRHVSQVRKMVKGL